MGITDDRAGGAEYVTVERAGHALGEGGSPNEYGPGGDGDGDMEKQMNEAATALDFERAAQLRDEVAKLRKFVNPGDIGAASRKDKMAGKGRRGRQVKHASLS